MLKRKVEMTEENGIIYNRSFSELQTKGVKWWPKELVEIVENDSLISKLIESQDLFISILQESNQNNIFQKIIDAEMPVNMFLKHLMILTDFGSERLQRVSSNFNDIFTDNVLEYKTDDQIIKYTFTDLARKPKLTNKKLLIDNNTISKKAEFTNLYKDIITFLLFGENATDTRISRIFSNCNIGDKLGNSEELNFFIKTRYIAVSKITSGSKANDLGNYAQIYVKDYLESKLGDKYALTINGHVPQISQNGSTETTFDLTVERNKKYVAIEISFQETTNSTIERKAGQAHNRYELINKSGNYVAYIIDGAGNFQRKPAITTICNNSHCTVAYSEQEFDVLVSFIKEKLGN